MGRIGAIGQNPIVGSARVLCQDFEAAIGTIGEGGTPQGSTTCPAGEVAVGIEGREGDFVDKLAVRCLAATLTGATMTAAGYGGDGGSADGPYDCPGGERLSGLASSLLFDSTTVRHLEAVCVQPTTTTVAIRKTERKLKVSGQVAPNQIGEGIQVTLYRKRSGSFAQIAVADLMLDAASAYRTAFKRPSSGKCRIVATFAGDVDNGPSSATRTFLLVGSYASISKMFSTLASQGRLCLG